jgi:hypothetical protein
MYAAAALAIDYEILPWGKRSTLRDIEKCMRLALMTLETGHTQAPSTTPAIGRTDTRPLIFSGAPLEF